VTASTNPCSQVYKLASGKIRPKSILTTLTKLDGSEATSIQETLEVLLDYHSEEDNAEQNTHQKNNREDSRGTNSRVLERGNKASYIKL
jgi:hypothetical protein